MEEDILRYITANALLTDEGLHLVALSGGADSVALLLILRNLGYRVEAVHCNFHLRSGESDRDERFCHTLCQRLQVPLHTVHFDTRTYSALHHVSIEMAARELRYNHFRQLRHDIGAETICVAHHRDDNAETVLMNLVRGTGLTGLAGIRPKNGCIVRPLLAVSRKDIEAYLTSQGQSYVTDSTNLVPDVTRNRIRLQVLPLLREINPSVSEALTTTARNVADALPLIEEALRRSEKECVSASADITAIDLKALAATPSPRYVLYDILSQKGFTPAMASAIYEALEAQTGKQWKSGGMVAVLDRGRLLLSPQHVPFRELRLPMAERYALPDGRHLIIKELTVERPFTPNRSPLTAQLDAERVRFPLTLRECRTGDRFTPFGMHGTRLVSDFLTDLKLSLIEKQRQLVLADATGAILWLPGQRISERCRITDTTANIIECTLLHD